MRAIYIELGDEITTVIGRIKEEEDPSLVLVAPKGAILIQSLVNLKLTARAAKEAGKSIVLVTTDKIGKNLASQAGIETFSSMDSAQSGASESVSEEGADEPKFINGVRVHRYYEETEATPTTAQDDAPAIAPIIPKKFLREAEEVKPLAPAPEVGEVSENAATTESASETEEEVMPHPVTVRSIETAPAVVAVVSPRGTAKTTAVSEAVAEEPVVPIQRRQFPAKQVVIGTLIVLLLLAGIASTPFFVPKATIAITTHVPTEESQQVITASTATTEVTAGTVPAELITVEVTQSVTTTSTGSKDVGEAASGTAKVINDYSTNAQTIPAGSRLSSQGLIFITQSAVTVPGFTAPDGDKIPGSVDVQVVAEAAGEASNLTNQSASFVTPATKVYGKIVATSGGFSKKVTILSQQDVDRARTAIGKQLLTAVAEALTAKIGDRSVYSDSATDSFTLKDTTVSTAVGSEVSEANLTAVASGSRLVVDSQRANEAAAAAHLTSDLVSATLTGATFSAKDSTASLTLAVKTRQRISIDTAALRINLTNQTVEAAQAAVDAAVDVPFDVTITRTPSWWPLKTLPIRERQITVEVRHD